MRGRRALFVFAVASSGAAAVVAVACGTDTIYVTALGDAGNDSSAARDAKKPPTTSGDDDDVPPGDDDDDATTTPPKDAGKDARADAHVPKDANGPGAADAECSFNHDCQLALRCECDGTCGCASGPRGKNKLGATCDASAQCLNGLCIEGPTTSPDFLCSDECDTPADCPANLPRCEKVSFVGRICVRQP